MLRPKGWHWLLVACVSNQGWHWLLVASAAFNVESPSMEPHRKLRKALNCPGHAHALNFTCNHGLRLLDHDELRLLFLQHLDVARTRWDFHVWAYVLMPEHVHVLIYPQQEVYDISKILLAIKKPFSRRALAWFEQHHPTVVEKLTIRLASGCTERHFWEEGGGYDRNIRTAKAAWREINYIHLNPVRRGMVENRADWRWSSCAFYLGALDVPFRVDKCEWWSS